MIDTFAPQFLLLVGIDIFLGGSILSVMLEDYFPRAMPYILDIGSFVGFSQTLNRPRYTANFAQTLQFYYCFGYLCDRSREHRWFESLSVVGKTETACQRRHWHSRNNSSNTCECDFASAYVNGIPLGLPSCPVLPMSTVYVLFAVTGIIIMFATITAVTNLRQKIGLPISWQATAKQKSTKSSVA